MTNSRNPEVKCHTLHYFCFKNLKGYSHKHTIPPSEKALQARQFYCQMENRTFTGTVGVGKTVFTDQILPYPLATETTIQFLFNDFFEWPAETGWTKAMIGYVKTDRPGGHIGRF